MVLFVSCLLASSSSTLSVRLKKQDGSCYELRGKQEKENHGVVVCLSPDKVPLCRLFLAKRLCEEAPVAPGVWKLTSFLLLGLCPPAHLCSWLMFRSQRNKNTSPFTLCLQQTQTRGEMDDRWVLENGKCSHSMVICWNVGAWLFHVSHSQLSTSIPQSRIGKINVLPALSLTQLPLCYPLFMAKRHLPLCLKQR